MTELEFGRIVWEASMHQTQRAFGGKEPLSFLEWFNKKYLPSIRNKKSTL